MLRHSVILIIGCAAASGFQQTTNATANFERRADIYAIYSLMMTEPKTTHGAENNDIYLIRDTTVPGTPPEPCVPVPPAYERRFAETLADYQRRKDTPATLERALNITKPYQLLNRDEAKEFAELHDLRPGPKAKPKELFQKATDLFGLTDVYFNGDRTLALTGISTYCGPLCGGYQWKVFEKTNRGWEERPWVGCRTIASAARPKPTPLMSS